MVIGQCIHSNNHTAKLVQGFNSWINHLYGIRGNVSVPWCKCKSQTSHSMHTRLRGSSVGCVFFSNDAQTLHAIAAVTRASLLSNPAYASSAPSFFSNLQNKHYISYHTVRVTMFIYYSSTCSPDSTIAQKFSCGETKCAYLARFGLAPHFQQLMIKSLKESGAFVVLFDESLNNVTQSKQLDVHIRT